MSDNKRKGGAQKLKEKKQNLLADSAKSCQNIRSIMSNQNVKNVKNKAMEVSNSKYYGFYLLVIHI